MAPLNRQVVAQLGGTALRRRVIGSNGCSPTRRPRSPVSTRRAARRWCAGCGSALAALTEQHDVVAGEQRALQLRDHRRLQATMPTTGRRRCAARSAGCAGSRRADVAVHGRGPQLPDSARGRRGLDVAVLATVPTYPPTEPPAATLAFAAASTPAVNAPSVREVARPGEERVTPACSAAAMTSSSRIGPPGCTTARTPPSMSTCRPSANGKNASDAATEPSRAGTGALHGQVRSRRG